MSWYAILSMNPKEIKKSLKKFLEEEENEKM